VPIYQQALQASENLYQSVSLLNYQAAEQAKTGALFRLAAYAFARTGDLQTAVLTLEQGRSRGLRQTLNRDRSDLARLQQTHPELVTQYQEITTRLHALTTQQRLQMNSGDRHDLNPEAFRSAAQQLRQSLTETIDQIRQISGYESFLAKPGFDQIHRSLASGTPLVYLVSTAAGSLALILTPDHISDLWFDNLTSYRLANLLNNTWFNAYHQSQTNRPAWLDAIDQVPRQLWKPLMAPLIDHLQQRRLQRAILIPSGCLSLLPLHAAWTEDSRMPTGRRYALDDIHFTYAPSAGSLVAAQAIAQRTDTKSILAIDDPRQDLPNASREVATAIATFPEHTVLKHRAATRNAVLKALPQASILHLSCHGAANFNAPLTSGFALSDGFLTLQDLFDLQGATPQPADFRLAILTACKIGLNSKDPADDATSLSIGLLQAGTAGVISRLWSGADLSVMMVLTRFYEYWRKGGLEPTEALRQAQQWVRDTTNAEKIAYFKDCLSDQSATKIPATCAYYFYKSLTLAAPDAYDFAHPFYWAAFSYEGV
jgi:CHAT domain-containing protein